MRLVGRHYDSRQAVAIDIVGDKIAGLTVPAADETPSDLPWLAPTFVDIQVNGYGGQEFSSRDLTPEKVAAIARRQYSFGVTRFFPTLTTHGREVFLHALAAIRAACEQDAEIERLIAGVHLEGPYLSAEDGPRGAHPVEHCRPPDWDEFCRFQEAAGGRVRLMTLAPELAGAAAFISRATGSGVVIALGHTAASGDQIRAAVDAGATLSTHLGNGAHRTLRRHPNYLWDQLAEDRLSASLIVDGHHLPREVVQCFVRGKTPQRCILVSDVSGLAGLPPGTYASSGCELEILADGRLVIAGQDQLLAGASLPIGVGVANVLRFAGVSLRQAVDMASRGPAELLGLPVAGLTIGAPADLVQFDLPADAFSSRAATAEFRVRSTIAAGRVVWG